MGARTTTWTKAISSTDRRAHTTSTTETMQMVGKVRQDDIACSGPLQVTSSVVDAFHPHLPITCVEVSMSTETPRSNSRQIEGGPKKRPGTATSLSALPQSIAYGLFCAPCHILLNQCSSGHARRRTVSLAVRPCASSSTLHLFGHGCSASWHAAMSRSRLQCERAPT